MVPFLNCKLRHMRCCWTTLTDTNDAFRQLVQNQCANTVPSKPLESVSISTYVSQQLSEKYFSEFNDFIMSENLPNSLSAYYPLNITELRLSFDIKRGLKASNLQELGINWGDQVWSPKIFQSSKLLWDEPSGEHLGINWRFWAHFSPSSFPTQTVLCIIDSLLVDKSKLIIKSSFRRRSHNIDGIATLKNSYLQGKFCVSFQHIWNTNLQSPVRLPIPPLF